MKIDLEKLKEMQEYLFKQQCDLDIQKAMVKHFIKKREKAISVTHCCESDSELFPNKWKERCLLAENYINETPCDPDIYQEQLEAWSEWITYKQSMENTN